MFFKTLSKEKPLIIELDDAHWIDEDSKKMFESFVTGISDFPIYIIATSRYLENGKKFKINLPQKIPVTRIELSQFDIKTTRKFIINKINELLNKNLKDINDNVIELIYEKTNGNPF